GRGRGCPRTGTKFLSKNTPVGSPRASFTISTLCGARVSRVTPARLSASELATDGKRTATPPAPHRTDVDGVVGSDRIEVMAIRKAAVGQLLRPADVLVRRFAHGHEHDPLACRCGLRRTFDDVDDVGGGGKAGDGDTAARLETFAVGVRMRVEKPRQYRTTFEVDELHRGGGMFEQCRVVADGHDVTRSHGDGLRQP